MSCLFRLPLIPNAVPVQAQDGRGVLLEKPLQDNDRILRIVADLLVGADEENLQVQERAALMGLPQLRLRAGDANHVKARLNQTGDQGVPEIQMLAPRCTIAEGNPAWGNGISTSWDLSEGQL